MTTPIASNADIAHQTRTQAARAANGSTTQADDGQADNVFAALFGLALGAQTDADPLTRVVPTTADAARDEAALDADDDTDPGAATDTAMLLASIPWHVANAADSKAPAPGRDARLDAAGKLAGVADQRPAATDAAADAPDDALAAAVPAPADTDASADVLALSGMQLSTGVRRSSAQLAQSSAAADASQAAGARAAAAADAGDAAAVADDAARDLRATAVAPASATTGTPAAATPATAADTAAPTAASSAGSDASAAPGGATVDAAALLPDTPAPGLTPTIGSHAGIRQDLPAVPGAPVPVHNGQQLQARVDDAVRWMSTQGLQAAEIRVTPDELGPITVRLSVQDGVASVSFAASDEQTRAALSNSLDGLRDALAASGLQLGDAQVGAEQQRSSFANFADAQGNGQDRGNRQGAADKMQAAVNAIGERTPVQRASGNGLVDLYA